MWEGIALLKERFLLGVMNIVLSQVEAHLELSERSMM